MTQGDSLMRENLIFLLQNMDSTLIQRISDFTHGLLNAPKVEEPDWWDDLTEEQQKDLKASLDAIDNGTAEFVSNEEVKDSIKKLLDSKKGKK